MDVALLEQFPKTEWNQEPSAGWLDLCKQLRDYEPPQRTLSLGRVERKWELVSAYQKTVRRGNKELALRLVSAMDSVPNEYGYWHKRVATTFTEDVGLADKTLVLFAIAALKTFTPKKLGMANYRLICFLTEKACDLAMRSRVYCSYSIIENKLRGLRLCQFEPEEFDLISWLQQVDAPGDDAVAIWCCKNNWRGEGMLKFIGAEHSHLELEILDCDWPPVQELYGLPSYAYDMHTRVGLICLARLQKIIQLQVAEPTKVLGWNLFYMEGGLIRGELVDSKLLQLEQLIVAKSFGMSMEHWLDTQKKVSQALMDGSYADIRNKITWSFYGRGQ